jgi:murein tripeptide amidase MpaA
MRAGEPGEGKRKVWVIARQHPGESMAEWFCEGMLHRLLDRHDPVSRKVLAQAVFYVVSGLFCEPYSCLYQHHLHGCISFLPSHCTL